MAAPRHRSAAGRRGEDRPNFELQLFNLLRVILIRKHHPNSSAHLAASPADGDGQATGDQDLSGSDPDVSKALKLLISSGRGDDVGDGDQILNAIDHMLGSKDCWYRVLAVEALCLPEVRSMLQGVSDLPTKFEERLKDPFPPVRRFAIEGLRVMALQNSEIEQQGLVSIALNDEDRRLRAEAVQALGALGEIAVPNLKKVLTDSDCWAVRAEAASALGTTASQSKGSHSTCAIALKALETATNIDHERHAGVRESAAYAIAVIAVVDEDHAVHSVLKLARLVRDPDLRVRIAAVTTVGLIISEAIRDKDTGLGEPGYERLRRRSPQTSGYTLVDYVRISCCVLVGVMRDRSPMLQASAESTEVSTMERVLSDRISALDHVKEFSVHEYATLQRSDQNRFMATLRSTREGNRLAEEFGKLRIVLQDLEDRRRGVCDLFRAAELAFEKIGHFAVPCMLDRLLAEESHDSGFINRMSILRGLHCTQHMGLEVACAMLSEWVADRNLDGGRFACTEPGKDFCISNTVPLTQTVMARFGRPFDDIADSKGYTWAVLHNHHGDVFVVFGLRPDCTMGTLEDYDSASELLHADAATPKKVAFKRDLAKKNHPDASPMEVHGGFWDLLDIIWRDVICEIESVVRHKKAEHTEITQLIFCGAGLGGGVAKVAALRTCAEAIPIPGLKLKMDDDGIGNGWGVEVTLYTYGAPHIKVERNNRKHIQLHHHCNADSCSFNLAGDPMPLMLSQHSSKVREHFQGSRGLCCMRRKYSKNSYVHIFLGMANHTSHHFKNMVKTEELKPADPASYQARLKRQGRRLEAFEEDLSSARAYTNAMCWRGLCQIMLPIADGEDQASTLKKEASNSVLRNAFTPKGLTVAFNT